MARPRRHVAKMPSYIISTVLERVPSRELLRRTLRVDCPQVTDRMLIFGGQHLRRVLAEYTAHYNRKRPHRSVELRPPRPDAPVPEPIGGRIRRRPVLGGLICEYEPAA